MLKDSSFYNSYGKKILITGANSGIGLYSTINLLKTKNYLFIPIKSISRKEQFLSKLKQYFDKKYINKYIYLIDNSDFSNLENIIKIRDFILNKKILLDIIILKAGIQYTGSYYPKVSKQGVELTFAINHLAHFYLTNLLIPFIKNNNESRIIITSSGYFFRQ